MVQHTFVLKAINGLNSKASAALVAEANKYASKLSLLYQNEVADLKSIMNVMALVIRFKESFAVTCDGNDEAAALEGIKRLLLALHLI